MKAACRQPQQSGNKALQGEQAHGLGEDPLPGPGAPSAHSITHESTLEQNLTLVNI